MLNHDTSSRLIGWIRAKSRVATCARPTSPPPCQGGHPLDSRGVAPEPESPMPASGKRASSTGNAICGRWRPYLFGGLILSSALLLAGVGAWYWAGAEVPTPPSFDLTEA